MGKKIVVEIEECPDCAGRGILEENTPSSWCDRCASTGEIRTPHACAPAEPELTADEIEWLADQWELDSDHVREMDTEMVFNRAAVRERIRKENKK